LESERNSFARWIGCVAGDVAFGTDIQRVGRSHAVLDQAEVGGLPVVTLLLISLEVLVDRGSLRIGAVGVHDKGVIEGERPSVVDGVDGGSGLILGGNHGMDGGVLFDVLFVERGLDLEGLQVGEVDILGDGCSDGAMGGVDVSGDLEVVARSCVDGAETFPLGACGDLW